MLPILPATNVDMIGSNVSQIIDCEKGQSVLYMQDAANPSIYRLYVCPGYRSNVGDFFENLLKQLKESGVAMPDDIAFANLPELQNGVFGVQFTTDGAGNFYFEPGSGLTFVQDGPDQTSKIIIPTTYGQFTANFSTVDLLYALSQSILTNLDDGTDPISEFNFGTLAWAAIFTAGAVGTGLLFGANAIRNANTKKNENTDEDNGAESDNGDQNVDTTDARYVLAQIDIQNHITSEHLAQESIANRVAEEALRRQGAGQFNPHEETNARVAGLGKGLNPLGFISQAIRKGERQDVARSKARRAGRRS